MIHLQYIQITDKSFRFLLQPISYIIRLLSTLNRLRSGTAFGKLGKPGSFVRPAVHLLYFDIRESESELRDMGF